MHNKKYTSKDWQNWGYYQYKYIGMHAINLSRTSWLETSAPVRGNIYVATTMSILSYYLKSTL